MYTSHIYIHPHTKTTTTHHMDIYTPHVYTPTTIKHIPYTSPTTYIDITRHTHIQIHIYHTHTYINTNAYHTPSIHIEAHITLICIYILYIQHTQHTCIPHTHIYHTT